MRHARVLVLSCFSLLTTAAVAAEPIAEAELSHSFKPEFVKQEG